MRRPVLAHVSAIVVAVLVILAVSALWIVNLRMGPRLDGFSGGAMVIILPIGLLIVTAIWILLRALFLRGRVALWQAFLGGAVLALILVVGNCGPTACFVPGNERLVGWFMVIGAGLSTLAHHLVLGRFSQERNDAQTA